MPPRAPAMPRLNAATFRPGTLSAARGVKRSVCDFVETRLARAE